MRLGATYHIELYRLCRGQVDDLELLGLGEVPLGEMAGQLRDAVRGLRGGGLVVGRQILDGL